MAQAVKITSIADIVHETIPVSFLEKKIISTEQFSRLHNVLQASTAYLTFPSARHSRYIHSLGCMHMAGKIFVSGLMNATKKHRHELLQRVRKEIEGIEKQDSFIDALRSEIDEFEGEEFTSLREHKGVILKDPLYALDRPGVIVKRKNINLFNVSYQSLRIAALLHDLGHLPFSHVCEHALADIYTDLMEKKNAGNSLNYRRSRFLECIDGLSKKYNAKFHEPIGHVLAGQILRSLNNIYRSNERKDKEKFIRTQILIISWYAGQILRKQSVLSHIFDSSVDADRLDFVSRDHMMAGLRKVSLNSQRLLESFTIVPLPPDKKGNVEYRFLPSARANSAIEGFFQRRFDFYTYVVSHHRVLKTDGLLQIAIKKLAKKYLDKQHKLPKTGASELPNDISGLWEAFHEIDRLHSATQGDRLVQWDDAWLLTMLRREYYKLKSREAKARDGNGKVKPEDKLLRTQLEELLSNRKAYFSLYKRVDGYWPVDEGALTAIPEDFEWSSIPLPSSSTRGKTKFSQTLAGVEQWVKEAQKLRNSEDESEFYQEQGYFIPKLFHIMAEAGFSDSHGFLADALQEFNMRYNFIDSFTMKSKASAGVTLTDSIAVESESVPLKVISRIATRLTQSVELLPPFYTYVLPSDGANPREDNNAGKILGALIWRAFETKICTPRISGDKIGSDPEPSKRGTADEAPP